MSNPLSETTIARMVVYSGNVQGVGFRAVARAIASQYDVAGWVRNLRDGRVELMVEGAGSEVEFFLDAIRRHWGASITHADARPLTPTGRFLRFDVMR